MIDLKSGEDRTMEEGREREEGDIHWRFGSCV